MDGDYTSGELKRVGSAGLENPALADPVHVLLDMSGAAGISRRSPDELRATADHFAAYGDRVAAAAILAPDDLSYGLMRMGETFFASRGKVAKVFRTRGEALAWLEGLQGQSTEQGGAE